MLARSFFLHIVPLAWLLSVELAHVAHADDADSCAHEASQGHALLSMKAETARRALTEDEAVQEIFADLREDSDSHGEDDDDKDDHKDKDKGSNASNTSWHKVNQTIRDLVNNVLVADINQTHQLPNPEGNYSDPENRTGLGSLAQTLEFLYLKVAELETAVELQNIEIQLNHEQAQLEIQQLKDRLDQKDADLRQLQSKLRQHAAERKHHNADVALIEDKPAAMLQKHRKAWLEKTEERRQQRKQRMNEGAHSILRRVLQKHHRQSDKKDWSSDRPAESQGKQTSHVATDGGVDLRQELAQRAANKRKSQRVKELDSSVSSKGPIDVITDTAGDVADGAGDLASDVADTATDVAT
ncbi:nipblb, partial [Symbiodinium sp. CCMP2456]